MWFSNRGRLFLRKFIRLVMSSKRSKINENASHSSHNQSSSNHHFYNHSYYMSVLQYEESRRQQLNFNLHNAFLSRCRLNQVQMPRELTTSQQDYAEYSSFVRVNRDRQSQTSQTDIHKPRQTDSKPLREWTTLNAKKNDNSFIFKVMSYNVLAQILMDRHRELYNAHKSKYLMWDYRWDMLRQEFKLHSADVICLQEVQESHLETFSIFFKSLGYDGIFKQRTGDEYPDGCAIFYNTKSLQMVGHQMVEYFHPGTTILNRNNVGIVAKFQPKQFSHSFAVATTHLLFNPKREDVRLAQMQVLLAELHRFTYDNQLKENIPVILCGDFNSDAKTSTNGVYQLITDKRVDYRNIYRRHDDTLWLPPKLGITNACKYLQRSNSDEQLSPTEQSKLFQSGEIVHDFNFQSVYDDEGVTTNQDRWVMVDYLFYSVTKPIIVGELKCLKRFELPTQNGLKSKGIKGIPNCKLGSDHFSLIAEFEFSH